MTQLALAAIGSLLVTAGLSLAAALLWPVQAVAAVALVAVGAVLLWAGLLADFDRKG